MRTLKNIIVGQSGGPTAVINASLAGVIYTAKQKGVKNIYGMRYGIQGLLEGNYVNLSDSIKSNMEIEYLKRTPSSYLGSCRYKLPDYRKDDRLYKQLFKLLTDLKIDAFFYIGGNDSMDTIAKLSAYANEIDNPIRFIGVPKTIDNDLAITDHTPGYGSAAKFIASTFKELYRDSTVYDIPSVTIIEAMGRNAGWLTAASLLCKSDDCDGPDIVLLPEVTIDPDKVVEKISEIQKKKKSIIVAISEGVKTADGRYLCEDADPFKNVDAFGHVILTGAANTLSGMVTEKLKCKSRAIELNTIQRCASHMLSAVDADEAFDVGVAAINAACNYNTGKVVILNRISSAPYVCGTGIADIKGIANLEKKIPLEWIDTENYTLTEEYLKYARPLIRGELYPFMVDGVPMHISV